MKTKVKDHFIRKSNIGIKFIIVEITITITVFTMVKYISAVNIYFNTAASLIL